MKKNLLIFSIINLFYFGSHNLVSAQAYNLLAVEGAHWIIVQRDELTVYPVDGLWEYYCNGDTTIDNVEYKVVYKRYLEVTQSGPPFTGISTYQIAGYIRDDTSSRKVYAIDWMTGVFDNCPNGEEYLLFDFSYNIGDSTNLCLFPFTQSEIIAIENLNLFNQQVKTFFTFSDYFYEGIGSNYGLFEEMITVESYSTSLDYYCPETPCDYIVTAKNIDIPKFFKIFPNPSTDLVTFTFAQQENWQEIRIYNCLGSIVEHYKLPTGTHSFTIQSLQLSPGIYFCGFSNTEKKSPLSKLVITR
jgi:hypothetical protein